MISAPNVGKGNVHSNQRGHGSGQDGTKTTNSLIELGTQAELEASALRRTGCGRLGLHGRIIRRGGKLEQGIRAADRDGV